MKETIGSRFKRAWNIFMNRDPTRWQEKAYSSLSYGYRPDRIRMTRGHERSIVTAICNRIALDVSAINLVHARVDENGHFLEYIDDTLHQCLTVEANIDQTGRALRQDIVMSMLDEGCVAVVPVEADFDPDENSSYKIYSLRTGKILEWMPQHVRVRLYDERTGRFEEVIVPKKYTAIIENPLFAVMNEPNSTMQRLIRKLNILDAIDEQSGSGKLDLIIQLPYVIKSQARKEQAEARRRDIEQQLSGSKYGIAYTDGTEHITQLNRGVENNLMSQIEYLTKMLYSQLGITESVMDGTANEETMLNYHNRTVEPILATIADEMTRTFLTKTARTQRQAISFFRDPFKLAPVAQIAEIADKFTRNEIMTKNEVRSIIGMKPSDDPRADELRNSNINQSSTDQMLLENGVENQNEQLMTQEEYETALADLDDLDAQLDDLEAELNSDDDQLAHYTSPYYDPVKAHEYYMKHRQLKGRTSTAGLNDEGKAAASYVKEQLTSERKSKVEANKEETTNQIDKLREQKKSNIAVHKAAMQKQIDSLRNRLSSMSSADKKKNRSRIQSSISALREQNAAERERLNAEFQAQSKSLRTAQKETNANLKTEYDDKYISELEKIKANPAFQKAKTGSKKSSSSKKTKKDLSYYMRGAPIHV